MWTILATTRVGGGGANGWALLVLLLAVRSGLTQVTQAPGACFGDLDHIGNGFCDPGLNTIVCAWDGGDCCVETCTDTAVHDCGEMGSTFNCLDATIAENPCTGVVDWLGDGICDSVNNFQDCNWDGGDCCGTTCFSVSNCGTNGFFCRDQAVTIVDIHEDGGASATFQDIQNTIFAAGLTAAPLAIPRQRWSRRTDGPVRSKVVVDPEMRRIFHGSGDGFVRMADTASGGVVWAFAAGTSVNSDPVLSANGTLFVGANNGSEASILALEADAAAASDRLTWAYRVGEGTADAPVLLSPAEDVVFSTMHGLGGDSDVVVALDAETGAVRWRRTLAPSSDRDSLGLTLSPDGTALYFLTFGAEGSVLRAWDAGTGEERWATELAVDPPGGAPAVSSDGAWIYATVKPGTLHARSSADGSARWRFAVGDADYDPYDSTTWFAAPALAPDDAVVYASGLYAVAVDTATGEARWVSSQTIGTATPVARADGTAVYFASARATNALYGLGATGAVLFSFVAGNRFSKPPALSLDGVSLFVGNDDGNVYDISTALDQTAWTTDAEDAVSCALTRSRDGSAVFVGDRSGTLKRLNAETGAVEWIFAAAGNILGKPAFSADDTTIYFGDNNGSCNALDVASGTPRWAPFRSNASVIAAMVLSADGATVYCPSRSGVLHALVAATGVETGRFVANTSLRASPVLHPDGSLIFVPSDDGRVYALAPRLDEGPIWMLSTGGAVAQEPGLSPSGDRLFASSQDGSLYAVDTATGRMLWNVSMVSVGLVPELSSPTVSPNGASVYVGASHNQLLAFDAVTGEGLWTLMASDAVLAKPTVSQDGRLVYSGGDDGNLYCLTSDGELLWTYLTRGDLRAAPVLSPDEAVVYFAGSQSRVFALRTRGQPRAPTYDGVTAVLATDEERLLRICGAPRRNPSYNALVEASDFQIQTHPGAWWGWLARFVPVQVGGEHDGCYEVPLPRTIPAGAAFPLRMHARTVGGLSLPSEGELGFRVCDAPCAPENVVATPREDGGARLTWDSIACAGVGDAATDPSFDDIFFSIFANDTDANGTESWRLLQRIQGGENTSLATVQNLVAQQLMAFTVAVENVCGFRNDSSASEPIFIQGAPPAPRDVVAAFNNATELVDVHWTVPGTTRRLAAISRRVSENDAVLESTRVDLWRNISGANVLVDSVLAPGDAQGLAVPVSRGVSYTFSVVASNRNFQSPPSTRSSIVIPPCARGFRAGNVSNTDEDGCQACEPGTFRGLDDPVEACVECPPGRFQSQTSRGVCDLCPPGYVSAAGSPSCRICGPGTQPTANASACEACAPGFYSPGGEEACIPTEANQRAPLAGASRAFACTICPPGTQQVAPCEAAGADTVCEICDKGRFQDAAGAVECRACPAYATTAGQGAFSVDSCRCVFGSERLEAGDVGFSCVCNAGWYLDENALEGIPFVPATATRQAFRDVCNECRNGYVCDAPGATLRTMELKEGYYRTRPDSPDVDACEGDVACLGGNATGDASCREGHSGPFCSICDDDRFLDGRTETCERCDSDLATGAIAVNVILIVLILGIVAACFCVQPEPEGDVLAGEEEDPDAALASRRATRASRRILEPMVLPPMHHSTGVSGAAAPAEAKASALPGTSQSAAHADLQRDAHGIAFDVTPPDVQTSSGKGHAQESRHDRRGLLEKSAAEDIGTEELKPAPAHDRSGARPKEMERSSRPAPTRNQASMRHADASDEESAKESFEENRSARASESETSFSSTEEKPEEEASARPSIPAMPAAMKRQMSLGGNHAGRTGYDAYQGINDFAEQEYGDTGEALDTAQRVEEGERGVARLFAAVTGSTLDSFVSLKTMLKITFSFLQMEQIVVLAFDLPTPPYFSDFLQFFSFIPLEVFSGVFGDCIFRMDFYQGLLAITIGPIILEALIYLALRFLAKRNETKQSLTYLALLVTFVVLPPTTSVCCNTFLCETLDTADPPEADTSFLVADYALECDTARHRAYQVYAGIMIGVYPVGIPLFYLWLVLRNDPETGDLSVPQIFYRLVEVEEVLHDLAKQDDPLGDHSEFGEGSVHVLLSYCNAEALQRTYGELEKRMFTPITSHGRRRPGCWAPEKGGRLWRMLTLGGFENNKAFWEDARRATDRGAFFARRAELMKQHINRLRFLLESFHPSFYWFELFEAGRRLMLAALPVFFVRGSVAQLLVGILATLAFLIVYLTLRPFVLGRENSLAAIAQLAIFLLFLTGLAMAAQDSPFGPDDPRIDGTLVALNVLALAAAVYAAMLTGMVLYVDSKTLARNAQRNRSIVKAALMRRQTSSSAESASGATSMPRLRRDSFSMLWARSARRGPASSRREIGSSRLVATDAGEAAADGDVPDKGPGPTLSEMPRGLTSRSTAASMPSHHSGARTGAPNDQSV